MSAKEEQWVDVSVEPANTPGGFDFMKNLPGVLRTLGTVALLVAMYSFLVRGWDSGNDVFRYFLLLGHTGALAAIGLASGVWLKESKGARLLLTLAVVSVPVNFAILGAFIFSQASFIDVSQYPQYVAWSVDSMSTGLLTTAIAMLVLVPVVFLGFSVLARNISRKLSLLFIFSNVALLIPLRDPQLVGLMGLALAICTVIFSRKASHQDAAVKTQEGVIALGLQLLPMAVLIGRSLWLYSLDLFLLTVLCMTVFFIMRQISLYLAEESKWRRILDVMSAIPSIAVMFSLVGVMDDLVSLPSELVLPLSAMVAYSMLYDISRRNSQGGSTFRLIAVGALMFGVFTNLAIDTSTVTSLICIAVGLGVIVHGYRAQQRSMFVGGLVMMAVGVVYQFYQLIHHFDLGSWASLAVLGVASIVIASTIESHGGKIKSRVKHVKEKFEQWDI